MEILVPAAGLSTRFPDMPPKYLLRDNWGNPMLDNALGYYYGRGDMFVGILKEHDEKYDATETVLSLGIDSDPMTCIILPEKTNGPADTVYQMLKWLDEGRDDGAFLVKDCDSFFDHEIVKGNYVCTTTVGEHEVLRRLGSKSFVQVNDQGLITDIIEKKVVSDTFCVGGYKFEKRSEYMAAFEAIQNTQTNEIYVSHVIQYMINQGKQFFTRPVTNYVDVGTIDEWNEYLEKQG
jgi:dTDP-glucose pyrophosphorylase